MVASHSHPGLWQVQRNYMHKLKRYYVYAKMQKKQEQVSILEEDMEKWLSAITYPSKEQSSKLSWAHGHTAYGCTRGPLSPCAHLHMCCGVWQICPECSRGDKGQVTVARTCAAVIYPEGNSHSHLWGCAYRFPRNGRSAGTCKWRNRGCQRQNPCKGISKITITKQNKNPYLLL